jgi:hypothetical protein
MRWFAAAGILVALAVRPALADTPQEAFDACATKTGAEYVKARDRYLSAPADDAFLKQKLNSNSWQERLAARILLGWQQHEKVYRDLLAQPKVQNQRGASFYPWADGRDGITAADVPLMYELLTKDVDPGTTWDAARALLALARSKPETPLDVRLLHQFVRQDASGGASRKAGAWLLGSLPAKYQEKDELLASLRAELGRPDKDPEVARSLLLGLGHATEDLSAKEKDQVVEAVLGLGGLKEFLGDVRLTYAVGNIGGDKASELVANYLGSATDDVDKRWALNTLSKADSAVATTALLKYADDPRLALRSEAIDGLGRARYTPEVGAKLEAIAMDEKAPAAQQARAVHSLVTISARHRTDKDVQKDIRSRLQTISAAKPQGDRLKNELKDILQRMRDEQP